MTLQIPLSPETEARLRERAAAAGKDLTTFVLDAVEEIAAADDGAGELSATEWSQQWHAWAASHRTLDRPADDSRESIYAGRGE